MKLIGKAFLVYIVFVIATMVGGAIVSKLPLSPPAMPPGTTQMGLFAATLVGSVVLVPGLIPLAMGLGGRFPIRWLALGLLLYVANGVNTAIELTIFSTMGGTSYLLVVNLLQFVAMSAALAWMFGSGQFVPSLPRMGIGAWAWRIGVAWLAFPVIYLVFGMAVGPFVIAHYQAGEGLLRLPSMDVILRTQLLRSLLFLGCSLPVIMLWTSSRRRLIVTLGLAHAVMVGLYGLSSAYWLPMVLRVGHSIEIIADSFAYALVLVLLFYPRTRTATASATAPVPITTAA